MPLLSSGGIRTVTGGAGVTNGSLSWDASDGATSYRISWGTSSGSYAYTQNVGSVTTFAFANLSPQMSTGTAYFMKVDAFDGSNYQTFLTEVVVFNGVQIG